jgi:arylsulfatase A-like enzyme
VDEWEINSSADPVEEFGDEVEARRRVYAGAIDYLDRTITPFVRDLLERTDRETTVVITADHGENLCYPADGGYWGHVGSLSNALLHVPLVVVNPPEGFDPDVSEPFSHLDLGSLLAGFGHDEGRRFVRDSVPAERVGLGVADDVEDFEFWDRGLRCVYEGEDRREWDTLGGSARFHVDGPSSETRVETDVPIPDGDETHFDEPLAAFKRRASQAQRSVDIADSTEDSLRELGYL